MRIAGTAHRCVPRVMSQLSDDDVRTIRTIHERTNLRVRADYLTLADIGRAYGVSASVVSLIVRVKQRARAGGPVREGWSD